MVNWWFGIRIKRCLFHNKYHSKGDPRIQTTNLPLAETTKTEETYCSKHSITILHLLVFEGYTCFFHFTTPPPQQNICTQPPPSICSPPNNLFAWMPFFHFTRPKKWCWRKTSHLLSTPKKNGSMIHAHFTLTKKHLWKKNKSLHLCDSNPIQQQQKKMAWKRHTWQSCSFKTKKCGDSRSSQQRSA